jgi:hypothetical protein
MPGETTPPRVLTWTFGQARDWSTTGSQLQPLKASFIVLGGGAPADR